MIAHAAALLLVLAAPGAARAPKAEKHAPVCSGTFSGAATGTFTCTVSATVSDEGRVFLVVNPTGPIEELKSYAPGAFELPPPLTATTYTLDSIVAGRVSVIVKKGGQLYSAVRTSGQRGDVTLTLRRVKPDPAQKGAYLVSGTLHARLVPESGVTMDQAVLDVKF